MKNSTTSRSTLLIVCLIAAGLTLVAFSNSADANIRKAGGFGIGLGSGTISNGLSLKYFMSSSAAVQGNVGTFGGGGAKDRYSKFRGLALSGDYLIEMPALASGSVVELGWNIGGGLGVALADEVFAAAGAFVAGLEFNFVPIPLDLVLEYRPSVLVVPDVGFDLVDFTGHVRIHF